MMFMPMFSPASRAPAGSVLTAGTRSTSVGWSGIAPETAFGSLTSFPTEDVAWSAIYTDTGLMQVILGSGSTVGYFSDKALTIGSDVYPGADIAYELPDTPAPGFTFFVWLVITPLVDGNEYTVSVT